MESLYTKILVLCSILCLERGGDVVSSLILGLIGVIQWPIGLIHLPTKSP